MGLTLQHIVQKPGHCGPATISMLFSFFGQTVTQDEIAEATGILDIILREGSRMDHLDLAVRRLRPDYQLMTHYNSTLNLMETMLHQVGLPVGVEWQGMFLEDGHYFEKGHYCAITDIDTVRGILTIADPEQNSVLKTGTIEIESFFKRWWEINDIPLPHDPNQIEWIRNDRLMFVVVPQTRCEAMRALGFEEVTLAMYRRYRSPYAWPLIEAQPQLEVELP